MVDEPEPAAPAVPRRAGRVLVVDAPGRVLLLHGADPSDPAAGTWWFTPGGGAEPHETFAEAAARELAEETGLVAGDLGGPVHRRTAEFAFDGARYRQDERYFLVRVDALEVDTSAWSELERGSIRGWGWFEPDEVAALAEPVFPEGLADLLRRLLGHPRRPSP